MGITALMLDGREPSTIQNLQWSVAAPITTLPCGDVWATTDATDLLIIERKTPMDLLGSIEDGRVFDQIARCRERSAWVYLVITGNLSPSADGKVIADGKVTRWRWRDVQGALLSIQEAGAGVVYCDGDSEFAETVQWLGRRDRSAEKPVMVKTATRVLTIGEQVLTSLPGIGLKRAQEILATLPTPAYALAWLTWTGTWQSEDVAGIGDGTKRNIRAALGLIDGQELYIGTQDHHAVRAVVEIQADDPLAASLVVSG